MFDIENTARLAVTAGLCASITLGGLPVAAIAAEVEGAAPTGVIAPAEQPAADASAAEAPAPEVRTGEDAAVPDGSVEAASARAKAWQGSGTAEDPYRIASVADLELLATAVNVEGVDYTGKHFRVSEGATFDMGTLAGTWKGIGTDANRFKGTFDGGGATIKGLTWSLFSGIEDATIQNLKLQVAIDVTGLETEDEQEVIGGLVDGALHGSCTIRGIEVSGSVAGVDYIGGVFGGRAVMEAGDEVLIEKCVNNARITSAAKGGGIAGYVLNRKPANSMPGTVLVRSCVNNGAVTAQYAGGISGYVASTAFESCTNNGAIDGSLVAGGIVGTSNSGTSIKSCKNTASVTCDGAAGGIMGSSASGSNTVSKSANTAAVTGVTNAGGIIGGTGAAGDFIDNCYNKGVITATGNGASEAKPVYAAGIFAYNNSGCEVKACLNEGKVVAGGANAKAYQIGKSGRWYDPAPGSKISGCYFKSGDGIVLASADGEGEGTPQEGMTRAQLAQALNTAGEAPGFWQPQNGTVQPDPLLPGALDDEASLVAQVIDAEGNVVEGYDSLAAALSASKDGQTVKLVKDVTLAERVAIKKSIVLDLGGHVITYNDAAQAISVYTSKGAPDVSATVQNGTIKAKVVGVFAYKANVTFRDLAIEAKKGAEVGYATDDGSYWGGLTIEEGTKIVASDTGVLVSGPYLGATEVPGDARPVRFTMNGGSIEAPYYAISGNGTYQGTEITINGGVLTSTDGAAIYHPQLGTLTLVGGELKGLVGVQMCSGNLVVPSGGTTKVTATGADDRENTTGGDGAIIDGAAVSIVNRDYPGGAPAADIQGGVFVSEKGEAILAYTWENKKPVDWEAAGDSVEVSGGSFSTVVPDALLGDRCDVLEQDENGNYVVHRHVIVKVDEVPATVGAAGTKAHYKCSACGELFWDADGSKPVADPSELVIAKLPTGSTPAAKPSKPGGDKLAQTGDASLVAMAVTGVAGAAALAAGASKRRRAE